MIKGIFTTALVSMSLINSVFACDIHGKTGFMPDNNLYISANDKASNNMTKERFMEIIQRVEDVYRPVVEARGVKFVVKKNWDDGTVNAYADQQNGVWSVNMFGGLARHELVTDDGFMLVVCHETGHHLGGAPKYRDSDWATNEGQADYFGNLKCMRKVLAEDDNVAIVSKMKVDAAVTEKCKISYNSADEVALCQRISMAGKSLAMLLGSLGGSSKVSFTTPDKKVVKKTNDAHPKAQCRLDTYFQGALCDIDANIDVSETDTKVGTCIKSDGHKQGMRPLCWYKPALRE